VCHAARAGVQAGSAAAGRRAPMPSPVTAALLAALQDSRGPSFAGCPLSAPPRAPAAPGLAQDAPRRGARAYVRPTEAAAAQAALPPSPFNTPYLLALPLPGGAAMDMRCMWPARGRTFYVMHTAEPCGHLVVGTGHACMHARLCMCWLAMLTVKPGGMRGPLRGKPSSCIVAGTARQTLALRLYRSLGARAIMRTSQSPSAPSTPNREYVRSPVSRP